MHRFYLPPEHCAGESLRLDGREAHHALQVLRLQHGELVTVLDGIGNSFICTVEAVSRNAATLAISLKNFVPAPPVAVTLLVGVPKGKIIESLIQKAVELGVRRIVPLLTERVVTQLDDDGVEGKRAKWQQVAIEAIKQCGTAWLPTVEAPTPIGSLLERREKFDLSLVGALQKERRQPREILREFQTSQNRRPQSIAIWIGPEGDFTPAELQAIQAAGASPITLGNLTLRVETAAIYCLSFLNYELQST
jgi:16S rRNA (uracil1498-N3)-methyltransferase